MKKFNGLLKRMSGCGLSADVESDKRTESDALHRHPRYRKMILEVAILNIRPGESADFEQAFAEAQAIIASLPPNGWGVQRIAEADKRTGTDAPRP